MKKIMSILISGAMMMSSVPFTAIAADEGTELWEKFLKYDLCITDYDSLTEKEQELCHFIYDTERQAEDTIICNRARAILAGYDVGDRITIEQAGKYKRILNPEQFLYYNDNINDYYEYWFPSLPIVPDISHIDEPNGYDEYWLDDNKSAVITYNGGNLDVNYYDNEGIKKYSESIPISIEEKTDIEKNGLVFSVLPDETVSVTKYKGTDQEVKIPSEIDGHIVKSIDVGAFSETDIVSVELPETIEMIYPYAFMNCSELTTINFPSGLKYIGYKAFSNCTSLKDVIIDCPYLKTCGNVFASAKAENVFLNIKEPSSWLYGGFAEVKNFSFGENTEILTMDYMFDFPELGIPESVSVIKALYDTGFVGFDEVTIPANIKIFGAYPEPRGVTQTEWKSFPARIPLLEEPTCVFESGCVIKGYKGSEAERYAKEWNLSFIALDDLETPLSGNYGKNITWTLDSDGVLTLSGEGEIPDRDGITPWFYQNSNINTVIVEDGITSIGKSVFIELKAVTSVSLPEGLKSIGNGAFSECFNLKTINIPDSMESIDEDAFYGCQLTELELPDNISYIGQRAFFACNIKTLKIPDKLTIIDVGTFSNCELNEVTISDNVKFINDVAFNGNSIKSVTIPESVEKVHYRAFSYCEDLEEVIFENPDTIIVDDDSTECNNLFYKIGYKGDEYYKGIFKGYKGSNAEKNAEISQLEFEALISKKAGDSNGDGRMNMSDAVLIMQSIANPDKYGVNGTDNSHITEQGQKNADTNGDGVTNLDALAIQKKLLKLE